MIRETKPRKAKFGFEISMQSDMLDSAERFAAFAAVLVTCDRDLYFKEYRNSAGTHGLTVYTNDVALATDLREAMTREPEKEYNVNQTITILNDGATYDTYGQWHDIKHVPRFEYGDSPMNGYVGTITYIGKHEFPSAPELYVIDGRYIVSARAFNPKD